MPNWCNNTLTLKDSNDSIVEVLKDFLNENGELDFEKIHPIPNELKGTTSPTPKDIDPIVQKMLVENYGHDNWYDWCVENWGTKWNCDVNYSGDEAICFTTAWSPPCRIVDYLAMKTKRDFRLAYIEEGVDFCGEYFSYADGSTEDKEYSPIEDAPAELKEELLGESWTWENNNDE